MPKSLPAPFLTLLTAQPAQLCRLFTITLNDGTTVFRFTDVDQDVVRGGQTYLSSPALRVRAVEASNGRIAQNTELVVRYVDGLNKDAAISGSYDNALVEVDVVSWADADAGFVRLITGFLTHRVSGSDQIGVWGVKGILRLADGILGEVFSLECRNNLGDSRCTIDISSSPEQQTVTVSNVLDQFAQFDVTIPVTVPEPAVDESGWFSFGLYKPTGTQFFIEVLNSEHLGSDVHRLTLALPTQNPVVVTDTGTLIVGCDKRHSTCVFKFDNAINAQQEVYAPLEDGAKRIV